MKNLLLIGLLILSGCAHQRAVLDSMKGKPKNQVIMSYGPPARTASDGNNGEILVYAKNINIPDYHLNYWKYTMFYINPAGTVYHWLIRNENIPPSQIDLYIK